LDQILDVAIQFAWGLHVAHELGVVHQDVKPHNALLTRDGLVKVADFGLAKARPVSAQRTGGGSRESVAVTAAVGTPAYFSPEQYDGHPLTRKTDIWSWAVSVLEMFTGRCDWGFGTHAPAELERYLQAGPRNRGLPAMPLPVADILRKCFRPDPAERWATMAEVCDALISMYRPEVGGDYSRAMPPVPGGNGPAAQPHDRRFEGGQWSDPKEWLGAALQARCSSSLPHGQVHAGPR
jgi:serine/threonine protein kinase